MLVLSRKEDEGFKIGQNISVKVVKINGNNVRLGIEAPRDVTVVRNELPDLADPMVKLAQPEDASLDSDDGKSSPSQENVNTSKQDSKSKGPLNRVNIKRAGQSQLHRRDK